MINKRSLKVAATAAVSLVMVVLLVALISVRFNQPVPPDHSGKIQVVAAENFWGNIAAQIGGTRVDVRSIVADPSIDPHLYESNARDAGAVGAARIVIVNGSGYDDFMDKLLRASPNDGRRVLVVAELLSATSAANPHFWYDIPRVKRVATAVEKELARADPAHSDEYAHNLDQFNLSLQPIIDIIAQIKAEYGGAPVVYTERVPEYLLRNAGLVIKTPIGFARSIEGGNEPSPSEARAMNDLLAKRTIKLLVYNSQATSAITQRAQEQAKNSGIPVIAVTETLPRSEPSFQSWQLHQVQSLLAALGG